MDLKQWRKGLVEDGTLPSGLKIKFKKNASVFDMAQKGKVPQVLLGMMKGNQGEAAGVEMFEKMPEMLELADMLIQTTWVEPPVTETPTDDSVTLAEIPRNDKFVYMIYILENSGGAQGLGKFRTKQSRNGDAVGHDGGAVRNEAVSVSSD